MNLQKLFETQRKLDEHIMTEHPELRGQNNLDWKILALQVELGECANEWRGFKKWSKDQEPRNKDITCHACKGIGGFSNGETVTIDGSATEFFEPCLYCDATGIQMKNPLLEEYVDCLHFILSIGLELNIPEEWDLEDVEGTTCLNITYQFLDFNEYLKSDLDENDWFSITEDFIGLGEMLGFTWEQIEQAYFDKNKINHERQNEGY